MTEIQNQHSKPAYLPQVSSEIKGYAQTITNSDSNGDPNSNRNSLKIPIILKMKIHRMITLWKKRVKKSKHRKNILKQWSETQKSYFKDLHQIISGIQQPLNQHNLITQEQDRILFPNMQAMLQLSIEVLKLIDSFLQNWNPRTTLIAEPLINLHNYFIIYREYCNNFAKSQQIIKKVKQDPKSVQIFKNLSMDVQSFIIKPVQRPPKYQLLLREYQKALPQQHPDYNNLTKAIEKYHVVNEENNQSMDLQIRNQIMITLDNKYGGIISATRVFLFEQQVKNLDSQLKMYIFNDMILVVKITDKEQGYKKILLDGLSFVQAPMDGKYLKNKLFICGIKDNLHVLFNSAKSRDRTYQQIQELIHTLYRKQTDRNNIKKKIKLKLNSIKIRELQIENRPKLRVTVVGVEKRPTSVLVPETVYILKIQSPFPNINFQHSYIKFESLVELYNDLRSKNKMLDIPIVDDRPPDMSLYDVKKNKTRIIQCRHIYIERFVNYILRCEQLSEHMSQIIKVLKINQDFWKFVGFAEPCTCNVCLENNKISSIKEYQGQKEIIRTLGTQSSPPKQQSEWSYSPSETSCIYNIFTLPKTILQNSVEDLNTLPRRLLWLECKIGRIDYSLFPKPQNQPETKITIHLQSLKDQSIHVKVTKSMTVLQVLDIIAQMYQIQTMRDFGLFLEYQNVPRYLDPDEILLEILEEANYELDSPEKVQESMWKKWKKWGEEMIGSKKSRLFIKKYLFVEDQLQIMACQQNPERYTLLVEQIFFRYKNQLMIFNEEDSKSICALYYILTYMDKLAYLNQANFQIDKIKSLVPQNQWKKTEENSKEIFKLIKQYEGQMENGLLPKNRRSTSSNIFSRLEIVYEKLIKIAHKSLGWTTMFFQVTNYDPLTLPGGLENLLLGINPVQLIIIEHKKLQPLLCIQLKKLSYKITVYSIFVETQERVYRFDGTMMYGVKNLIQNYKLLGQKFRGEQTIN